MTITIRDSEVEDLVRRIGERTGEEPDAVVSRLVRREAVQESTRVPEEEVKRRIERIRHLRSLFPPPEPPAKWGDLEEEMDSIFGSDPN